LMVPVDQDLNLASWYLRHHSLALMAVNNHH
jgi:hypothetical protein